MSSSRKPRPRRYTHSLGSILGDDSTLRNTLVAWIFFTAAVLLFWEYGGLRVNLYSSPTHVLDVLLEYTACTPEDVERNRCLPLSVLASAERVVTCLLFAGACFFMGMWCGMYRAWWGFFGGLFGALYAYPKYAVVLLHVHVASLFAATIMFPLLWTGAVIAMSLGFFSATRFQKELSRDMGDAMAQYCHSRWQFFRHMAFPLLFPSLFSGLKVVSATLWPMLIYVEPTINQAAAGIGNTVYLGILSGTAEGTALFFLSSILIAAMNVLTWWCLDVLERLTERRAYGT